MPKSVEAYLKGNSRPRYMERLLDIEAHYRSLLRELELAYALMKEDCCAAPHLFAGLWRSRVHCWAFDDLNELIREHNQWYPAEVDLPMDPRTRDFIPVRGASYRRIELAPEWVLEHFPPSLDGRAERPAPPRRAPREPASPARPRRSARATLARGRRVPQR
jgi:hypothetical protein